MIQEITLNNISIKNGESKEFKATGYSGKILKVLYEPVEGLEVTFKMFTKEGEEIMNVSEKGVYYPRVDISNQKYRESAIVNMEQGQTDYFYFYESLFFEFSVNNPNYSGEIVKKVVLIYDS